MTATDLRAVRGRVTAPAVLFFAAILAVGACRDDPAAPLPSRALEPLVVPAPPPDRLLRPRALVASPDGRVALVEEGRLTLTTLNPGAPGEPQRVSLRPADLDATARPVGSFQAGGALARTGDAYVTLVGGLGPVMVPAVVAESALYGPAAPAAITLGIGAGGAPPEPGLRVGLADLRDVRGLAATPDDRLLVALPDRLLIVDVGADPNAALLGAVPGAEGLRLGEVVGLAVDSDGTIYLTEAGTGLVLRLTTAGERSALAGGGDEVDVPVEPAPAESFRLSLDAAQLVLDASTRTLWLLQTGQILAIDLSELSLSELSLSETASGGAGGPTLRALPSRDRSLAGLALVDGELFATQAGGGLVRANDEGLEPIIELPPPLALARACTVETVGRNGLAIQDPSQRNLALWVAGFEPASFFQDADPVVLPPAPLAAGRDTRIYFQSKLGLLAIDLAAGTARTIGLPVPVPFVPGQTVEALPLSDYGVVRPAGDGGLWLLEPDRSLVIGVAPDDGALSRVAGVERGNIAPRGDDIVEARRLRLEAPTHLASDGDWLFVADDLEERGHAVYAVNTAPEARELQGREVPAESAVLVGGIGDSATADDAPVDGVRFDEVTALAALDGRLAVALAGQGRGLWLVEPSPSDAGPGRLRLLEAIGDGPVDAIIAAALSDVPSDVSSDRSTVVVYADAADWIQATNLGDEAVTLADIAIPAGERRALGRTTAHVVDLGIDGSLRVLTLQLDGEVGLVGDGFVATIGQTVGPPRSLAALEGGGAIALDGGLWAMGFDDNELLGAPLPEPPGDRVVAAGGLPRADTRLSQLTWRDGVVGMVVGDDGSLWWLDGPSGSLRSAAADGDGVTAESAVTTLAAGLPIAEVGPPYLPMAFGRDETAVPLYIGLANRVVRLPGGDRDRPGRPDRVAGGGDAAVARGVDAGELALSAVSGLAVDDEGRLLVRAREGLIWVADGIVERVEPDLGTDVADAQLLALADSLAILEGRVVLVQGGGVYRLRE